MFERILIPVDFSDASRGALFYGDSLAEKCASEIFVVHVLTHFVNAEEASKFVIPGVNWLTAVGKDLEEFVQQEPNKQRRLAVLAGEDASSEILKYSADHSCGLIVVGSHGHSSFINALLGSTAQKLMRHSTIPVMIVPGRRKDRTLPRFEDILIPTDFSDISLKALKLGIETARLWNSTLHLIHVVDLKELWAYQKDAGQRFPRLGEFADKTSKMSKILEEAGFAGPSKLGTFFGDPDEEILKYAKEQRIDFILMGSHGRKGLDRVLIGSTTASVVRHAETPVITVCEQRTDLREWTHV